VKVPFVVDKNSLTAIAELKAAGLTFDATQTQASTTVQKDFVISQTPDPGSSVTKGTKVTLVISTGAPPAATINLPDVTGQTYDAAAALLQADGFVSVVQSDAYSDTVPPGSVVSMNPTGGVAAQYPKTQTITLFVSTGPNPADTTTTEVPTTVPQTTTTEVTTTTIPKPTTTVATPPTSKPKPPKP
jgi:serine/threonine-protein kinase